MHVVVTAGHVDHGKSALIRALTGMEPDRWAEERRRGMTIDLGFGWLTLPSGDQLAFVDVPGHERFVTNMLAGAGPVPAVHVRRGSGRGLDAAVGRASRRRERPRHQARPAGRDQERPGRSGACHCGGDGADCADRPRPAAGRRGQLGDGRGPDRARHSAGRTVRQACPSRIRARRSGSGSTAPSA